MVNIRIERYFRELENKAKIFELNEDFNKAEGVREAIKIIAELYDEDLQEELNRLKFSYQLNSYKSELIDIINKN